MSSDEKLNNMPSGGFPPIFIIDTKTKEIIVEKNKNREFAELKASVNIKDILKSKIESQQKDKPLFDI